MVDRNDNDVIISHTSPVDKAFGIDEPQVRAKDPHKLPKTIGERAYNGIQFWFVKGLILAATAFFGYYAKFGSETNLFRRAGLWTKKNIQIPVGKLGEAAGINIERAIGGAQESAREKIGHWIGAKAHEIIAVLGAATAGTLVLGHGGNIVAPVVEWFENHRKKIIAYVNRHWGKPGDEALGNEKFKDLPKQNAWDVIKGRIVAWTGAYLIFVTGYILAGKLKGTHMYRVDALEERWARQLTGFKKIFGFGGLGKEIENIPVHYELNNLAHEHPEMAHLLQGQEKRLFRYKIARIVALDFFVTSATIIMWNITSRLSAHARVHGVSFGEALKRKLPWYKPKEEHATKHEVTADILALEEAKPSLPDNVRPFRNRVANPSPESETAHTQSAPATSPPPNNVRPFRFRASMPVDSHTARTEQRIVEIAQQI